MATSQARPARALGMQITPMLVGKWALFAAFLAVGLVAYGSWLRTSGSGLGCPDWPLCNGKLIPENRAAAIESGHRWFASITLLAVFFTAFLGLKLRRQFPRGAALLIGAAALGVAQAVLGAVVVLLELPPMIVLVHLSVALAWIALLTIAGVGYVYGREPAFRFVRPGWHLLLIAVTVLLLGSAIVASNVSFECAALPLCDQASSAVARALHSLHRSMALVLLLGAVFFLFRLRQRGISGPLFKVAVAVATLLLAQVLVGISMVASRLPVSLQALHGGLAAAIWMALVWTWALAVNHMTPVRRAVRRARARGR